MKKLTIAVLALFILSIAAIAIADEDNNTEETSRGKSESAREKDVKDADNETEDSDEKENKTKEDKIEAIKERAAEKLEKTKDKFEEIREHQKEKLMKAISKCKQTNDSSKCEEKLNKRLELVAKLEQKDLERLNKIEEMRNQTLAKIEKLKKEIKSREIAKDKIEKLKETAKQAQEKIKDAVNKLKEHKSKLEEKKDKLKECEDEETDDCKAVRAEAKNEIKQFLGRSVDQLLAHLENVKAKVQSSQDMSEEKAAEIIKDLDAQISKVKEIKIDLESLDENATAKELKAIAKELKKTAKEAKNSVTKAAGRIVNERIGGILVKSKQLQEKLEKTMTRMAEAGKDTSAVETLVSDFNAKLAEAETNYKSAKEAFANDKVQEGQGFMNKAKTALQDATKILRDINQQLKEQEETVEDEA